MLMRLISLAPAKRMFRDLSEKSGPGHLFATAFATQNPWTTFLVGLSASVGAGISMCFTEAAHDDGKLSGRGSPWKRGLASGIMTTLGGLGA